MRPYVALALCLSALGSFAPASSAQSCTLPAGIENLRPQAGCSFDHFPPACAPDGTVRFEVDVRTIGSQSCPYTVTWDFGDGTQEQTTTNTVEHVFTTTGRRVIKASVLTHAGVRSTTNTFDIVYGFFEMKPLVSTVTEGDSFAITVTRSNPVAAGSVDYATQFSQTVLVQTSGTLSFAPGEAQKKVTFQTIANAAASGDRSGRVEWTNPVNYQIEGGHSVSFVNVTDDDPETYHRCRASSLAVQEPEGKARIFIDRSGQTAVASTGTVTTTATWRMATGTWSVSFEPGQTEAFIDVPIEDNDLWDGMQQTRFACGGFVEPAHPHSDDELLLTVFDDDPKPELTVPAVVTVIESDSKQTVTIPLTLSAGYSFRAFIALREKASTASEDDFELKTHFALVDPGALSVPIEIELTGDDVAENDEQFTITLTEDLSARFTVKIVDDDRAPFAVDFDEPSYTAGESSASLTLTRSGDTSAPGTVTLHFEPVTGYGDWPADLDVTFAAGETTKVVPLPLDDQWYTGDRTATLVLSSAGLAGATAEITLHDDDPQPVVSLLDASVREGAPGETATALVTILLSAPLGVDLDVRAATVHGTAGDGDYTPLENKRVSIPAGAMAATVTLQVAGDDADEEHETFTLMLTRCCDPAVSAGPLTATVTIRDDDETIPPPPPSRRRSVRH